MFSSQIISRRIDQVQAKTQTDLIEYDPAKSREITQLLTEKRNKAGFDENGRPRVAFSPNELKFIRNESIMCSLSFAYWSRYAFAELDAGEGGGTAPVTFWPSQNRTLKIIADKEDQNWADFDRHGFSTGIQVVWHKTRQQGATALARLINMHRMTTRRNTRAIAASLDETKIHELYTRDKVVLDNLPFFLLPRIEYDVKDTEISFEEMKSRITYQQSNQQAGVGTGQQFDVSHMTEVALWPYAHRLQFDFFPAIPKHPDVFVGLESTANGKGGFWYDFTESVRLKTRGFEQWIYSFTPWYINHGKNRLIAPDNWTPLEITQKHGELVERTSIEFAGETIRPNRNQLYWWETEYQLNRSQGTLHIFFSNYPATPEQSFQHTAQTALPVETIDRLRSNANYQLACPYHVHWIQ
jgi:hypothetical protein